MSGLDRAMTRRLGPDWRRRLRGWGLAGLFLGAVAALVLDPVVSSERETGRLDRELHAQTDEGSRRIWLVRGATGALRRVHPLPEWSFKPDAEICLLIQRTLAARRVRASALSLGACEEAA